MTIEAKIERIAEALETKLERIAAAVEAISAGGGAVPSVKTETKKTETKAEPEGEPEGEPKEEPSLVDGAPTQDDVNAAAMQLNNAKGREALLDALKHVGVEGAGTSAVAEGKRAGFIAKCAELAA